MKDIFAVTAAAAVVVIVVAVPCRLLFQRLLLLLVLVNVEERVDSDPHDSRLFAEKTKSAQD